MLLFALMWLNDDAGNHKYVIFFLKIITFHNCPVINNHDNSLFQTHQNKDKLKCPIILIIKRGRILLMMLKNQN